MLCMVRMHVLHWVRSENSGGLCSDLGIRTLVNCEGECYLGRWTRAMI